MQNKIKFVFFFICIASLVGCKELSKEFKVGFLLPSLEAKRWVKESAYFEEKIKEAGGTVVIKDAGRNEATQYTQALELINEGVDFLVITAVNANSAGAIVRLAHAKGIKVIAYDGLIKNCDLDYFITFDGDKVGELMAKHMIKLVPQGNYVLFTGDKGDDNAKIFIDGAIKVLQPSIDSKKINIIYSGYMEEWSGKNAAYFTERILEFSNVDIHAIISTYDGLSDGISDVLNKKGLTDKIPITGQDAEIAACYRILNNRQAMTIYKPGKALAYKCAEIIIKTVKNEKIVDLKYTNNGRIDVPSIILDPIAIDKNNLESTVVADGFLAMDDILKYQQN